MKIGLFDSGIGGLNVLKECLKKYPNNTYYYYGDTKNVPYGNKDRETLLNLSLKIIHFFEEKKVDLIIIACGTISSTCYELLKKSTKIPMVDIISPTLNFLQDRSFSSVLVFGTKRTIESHIFKNKLGETCIEVATPEFVPMIENSKIEPSIIKNYLENYKTISALVLGCTHYPILKEEFKKYLNKSTCIIDMGVCLVNSLSLLNIGVSSVHLYFTKIDGILKNNIDSILKTEYSLELIE